MDPRTAVSGWWRRLALLLVLLALAAVIVVRVADARCEWGTFAYIVSIENPESQEDWRGEAAVLVDGVERIVATSRLIDDEVAVGPRDVAVSPDGKRVVVAMSRGSISSEYEGTQGVGLVVYGVDGSLERRLTDGGSQPDWSPDGERIAYTDGGLAVGVVDADGGNQRTIFRLPASDREVSPVLTDIAWSGDSERIAFLIHRPGPNDGSEIWTMRADGTDRERVLVTTGIYGDLAWSPDGGRFAWYGFHERVFSVVMADVSTGRLRQVEPNASDPVWSKDGRQLAFVIGDEGRYAPRIVVGDGNGDGEEAVPVPDDARGGSSLDDWASC